MGTLRLLLAISVLLKHVRGCHYAMTGGATSVETFFIISGFLIAMILDVKYNKPGQLWLFYSNRALRIYSTYWLILVGVALMQVAAHCAVHQSVIDLWLHNAARLGPEGVWYLAVTNVVIVGQDLALFMSLGHHGLHWSAAFWHSSPVVPTFMLIPPAWSLSLELTFYAISPWILRQRTRWIAAILGLSVAIRIVLWFAGFRADPWSYRFFPNEISLFLAGALAYRHIYRRASLHKPSKKTRWFAFGMIPAVVLYPVYSHSHGLFFSTTKVLYLVYAVTAIPMLFRITGGLAWDRRLGELSYPLYLCHFSIVQALDHFALHVSLLVRISVAIVVSCGVAWVCVVVLERPLDHFRQSRVRRSLSASTTDARNSIAERWTSSAPLPVADEAPERGPAVEPAPDSEPA